ncbi:putative phosphatase regulatory subunit-domain-containing protein [Cunninghamella echinulata]|nr:putative phosphatase regulatory subunit-domain-containing protein [Cunninghamella echinulata]
MTTIIPLIHTQHSLSSTTTTTTNNHRRRRVSINRCNTTTATTNQHKNSLSEPTTPITPMTPTTKKKMVRFCQDDDLEQVRLFLKSQMPKMIRSGDPPFLQEPRYELKCIDWPSKLAMYKSLNQAAIRIENVQLEHDQLLFGRCRVANLAYEKKVMIRYSFDYWDTFQEIQANYREPIASTTNTWDRFTFELPLPSSPNSSLDNKKVKPLTCFLALKYIVNGREFWDNNDGKNYQLDLIPTLPSTPPLQLSDNEDDEEEDMIDLVDDNDHPHQSLTKQQHPLDTHQLKHRYNFSNARQQHQSHSSIPDTLPTLSPTLHVGYQDFISKYCFYNSSSILQN